MVAMSCLTELNVPRRIAWRVMSPNQISIWLIQDAPVGVRWKVMFGSRIYRRVLPLLEQAVCLHVPSVPEVLWGRLVLVDGTLVPTGSRTGHEDNYSGKRHRSGLAIQVLSSTGSELLAVSAPYTGRPMTGKHSPESATKNSSRTPLSSVISDTWEPV